MNRPCGNYYKFAGELWQLIEKRISYGKPITFVLANKEKIIHVSEEDMDNESIEVKGI